MRALNVNFELLPDELATPERLKDFRVVIAPSCAVGFESKVLESFKNWVEEQAADKKPQRWLVVSTAPQFEEYLGIKPASIIEDRAAAKRKRLGKDMNCFIDIGEEGDEEFLISGFSVREDWGKLPADKFGATKGRRLTVRWFPGEGRISEFLVLLSPNRSHILRFSGNCIWENELAVYLDDRAGRQN